MSKNGSDEKPSERFARERLESILGIKLDRVPEEPTRKTPDYSSEVVEGLACFEVKELAASDWQVLKDGFNKYETERATSDLSMHWMIALFAELPAERMTAPPRFPEDDEEQIARLAAAGLTITRKAERVADFERRRAEQPEKIRLKGLVKDLIPDLQVLEANGITSTRGPEVSSPTAVEALWRIARRTRNAICLASPPNEAAGLPSGVFMHMGYGHTRSGQADTIADRIQAWFDTESKSENLIKSLECEEYQVGHAVLVFNELEPELSSSRETETFLPVRSLTLPESVDVVWALLVTCTLMYSADSGWNEYRHEEPPRWDRR